MTAGSIASSSGAAVVLAPELKASHMGNTAITEFSLHPPTLVSLNI